MRCINRLIFGSERNLEKRGIIWNMFGSAIYAVTSMLLGVAVTRMAGADIGGIFFFAFSTFGQQMFIVSYFGMRPIQITDTMYRYSFTDYRRFRYVTCTAATVFGLVYALIFGGDRLKQTVIFLMVIYRVIDGMADCFEAEFQREGRLDLTGKSNAFRTILSATAFLFSLMLSRDIVTAGIVSVFAQAAGLFIFCIIPAGDMPKTGHKSSGRKMSDLFRESAWLFLSAFLDLYIFASAKYAVNNYMPPSASSYFTTIFIPTSVINLMANFVIRPVLTKLSDFKNDEKMIAKITGRISGVIASFTVLGCFCAWLFGIPVLKMLLGKEAGSGIVPYRGALVCVILGGGFYALLNLLYYILVIYKKQRAIFLIYTAGVAMAYFGSAFAVSNYGINGAAVSYLILMIIITMAFAIVGFLAVKSKEERTHES